MQQSTSDASKSIPADRLTIAHLMLWIATTAGVFVGVERIWRFELHLIPPNAPSLDSVIGYDGPATAEAEHRAGMRKHLRAEIRLACIALAFAPVYGAAIALSLNVLWKLTTRLFGSSAQPGYWLALLVTTIVLNVGWGLVFDWNNTLDSDVSGLRLFGFAGAVALAAAVVLRQSTPWRWAFALGGAGFVGMAWIYWLEAHTGAMFQPANGDVLTSLPGLLVFAALVAVAIAVGTDLVSRRARGTFHWIGLGVTVLALCHVMAEAALSTR